MDGEASPITMTDFLFRRADSPQAIALRVKMARSPIILLPKAMFRSELQTT